MGAQSRTVYSSVAARASSPIRWGRSRLIYGFLGEPLHPHDPAHIEPC